MSKKSKTKGVALAVGGAALATGLFAAAKLVGEQQKMKRIVTENDILKTGNLERLEGVTNSNRMEEKLNNDHSFTRTDFRAQSPGATKSAQAAPQFDQAEAYSSDEADHESVGDGLDPGKSYGYTGTTHLNYNEKNVPQVPTRLRFGDIPAADRTQGQWNAYHYDMANRTEAMRDALNNLRGFDPYG